MLYKKINSRYKNIDNVFNCFGHGFEFLLSGTRRLMKNTCGCHRSQGTLSLESMGKSAAYHDLTLVSVLGAAWSSKFFPNFPILHIRKEKQRSSLNFLWWGRNCAIRWGQFTLVLLESTNRITFSVCACTTSHVAVLSVSALSSPWLPPTQTIGERILNTFTTLLQSAGTPLVSPCHCYSEHSINTYNHKDWKFFHRCQSTLWNVLVDISGYLAISRGSTKFQVYIGC